jgi:hypothetical protein
MINIPKTPCSTREQLLRSWPDIFPGIDRIVALYANEKGNTGGEELLRNGEHYIHRELLTGLFDKRLIALAGEQPGYVWLKREHLPFEASPAGQRQLDIFSEEQHVIMLLRIKYAEGMDLYYLFFREDQSNFGVSRLQGSLDTARKALLGSLVYRFARLFYLSFEEHKKYLQQFTDVTRSLMAGQARQSVHSLPPLWLKQWTEDYLNELYLQSGINVRISQAGLDYLATAKDYNTAKNGLEQAAKFAMMMAGGDTEKDVIIEEAYIVFKTVPDSPSTMQNHLHIPASRMQRTQHFLDRMEQSASILSDNGEDLTSSAVGKTMERPISAPAISDALRKNKRRILILLEQYPTQWPLIRQYFKPLINILDKEKAVRQIS